MNQLNMISIIHSFSISDLKTLLNAFQCNTKGNKSNLRDRALNLLQNKSRDLDHQAYLFKILEINHSMRRRRNVSPSNDQYQQIQQYIMKQPTNTTPVVSTPVIRRAREGNYTHNLVNHINQSDNIQNSSKQAGIYNIDPQISATQQTNGAVNIANSFIPSARSLANAHFTKNPFCEIVAEVIKISTLVGDNRLSILSSQKETREAQFKFTLSPEQASDLQAVNRDVSNRKNECVYQLQFRIGLFERGCTEIKDYLPLELLIRLNNILCPLPKMAPITSKTQPGSAPRRLPQFINCTTLAKPIENTIVVNWIPDVKNYVVGMYLVKKLTSDTLIQKLKDKAPRSTEDLKNMIRKKSVDSDPDLSNTSHFCSLVCPLGQIRVKIPAKSSRCNHLNCFDAGTYILMNEKTQTWKCPICKQLCLYDDILIESYFLEVISSPKLPESCKEIKILADGSWSVSDENKETLGISVDDKGINSHNPNNPKRSENMASHVDLTLSDDE